MPPGMHISKTQTKGLFDITEDNNENVFGEMDDDFDKPNHQSIGNFNQLANKIRKPSAKRNDSVRPPKVRASQQENFDLKLEEHVNSLEFNFSQNRTIKRHEHLKKTCGIDAAD